MIRARRLEDAEIAVKTDAAIGCMMVDWGKKGLEGKTASLINLMRRRGLDFPIILLIRHKRFEDLPVEVLDFIDGYGRYADQRPDRVQAAARRQCAGRGRHPRVLDADVSGLQAKQFVPGHLPEIAMSPRDAARCLVRNDVDYLPIDAIAGRIATTPFVVYPPGIATIVPGERLAEPARPMLDYLKMFEAGFNLFPGFEVEIQGVYREVDASGQVRLHAYVVPE